jgi:DUF917 family protein
VTLTAASLTEIGIDDIDDLSVGCTVLAAGGGGDPLVGSMMARAAVRDRGPVPVVRVEDLDPDGLVVPCCMAGAPTVMTEKIPNGSEGMTIRDTFESLLGRRVVALMPLEMGGINGLLPVAWAAHSGLPLLDADLMGRAFPHFEMCSPQIGGVSASPAVLTDERGQSIVFHAADNFWLERLMRSAIGTLGGSACTGAYPMVPTVAARSVIPGTVSAAAELGRSMRAPHDDPIAAIAERHPLRRLIFGKVVDIDRRTGGGFVRGSAVVEGIGVDRGRLVRLEFQNENLVALEDGEPVAMTPDIITAVDLHTATGITTEALSFGRRVTLIALRSPSVWVTPAGLALVGPRAFGYDFDFRGIEADGG